MEYYIEVRDSASQENKLTSAISNMLREQYEGKIVDGRHYRALVETIRLDIAEMNNRFKRCRPVDHISSVNIDELKIVISSSKSYYITLALKPVKGTIML